MNQECQTNGGVLFNRMTLIVQCEDTRSSSKVPHACHAPPTLSQPLFFTPPLSRNTMKTQRNLSWPNHRQEAVYDQEYTALHPSISVLHGNPRPSFFIYFLCISINKVGLSGRSASDSAGQNRYYL
jgi:hypothetical protein